MPSHKSSTHNHSSSSSRMADSFAGTSPRAQPANSFSLGHRPTGWLERRRARGGGRSQLSPAHRQLFSVSCKLEDVQNYEELKRTVQSTPSELESAINGHLQGISKIKKDIQNQLGEQLGDLFTGKQLADVKIVCEGQTFDCHQAILAARSPVFMAMFQSNMKEKETKKVSIDDFKAEVVSEMLNFIYTGNVSTKDIGKIATELLAAADKYQLDLLKKLCEERLCSTLKVTNCVEYLVFGDMNQTFKLRSKALKLVAENVDSIIDTDVFKDLFKQMPELAWEVMKAQIKK